MSISIKISEENYKRLCSLSGRLMSKLHRTVSINEAIDYLYNIKGNISDLAGTLEMSDKEVEDFAINIKKGWKRWIIKSV